MNSARNCCDVVVIGAGPAGSLAAARLCDAGLRVVVVERAHFPRFVIGESLLPRCLDLLDEARMLEPLQGRSYVRKTGAMFIDAGGVHDFDFSEQFGHGRDHAWHVPRDDFDAALAEQASERGAEVRFGCTVRGVELGCPVTIEVEDERGRSLRLSAPLLLDASGQGRVLARQLGLAAPSRYPPRSALFAHVTGHRPPAGSDSGRIWIYRHPAGPWGWVIPLSSECASVGYVGAPAQIDRFGVDAERAFAALIDSDPAARPTLARAELRFAPRRADHFASETRRCHGPGYCLLGNAAGFLDPVFSSGVTIALESATRAAELVVRQLGGGAAVDWEREYDAYLHGGSETFAAFIDAWYDGSLMPVFASAHRHQTYRRQICAALAGYVWDRKNPFTRNPARRISQLAALVAGA